MAHIVTLEKRAKEYGCETISRYLQTYCRDSVVTALCSDDCDVEPDGKCSHGFPSPLLAAGVI